MAVGMKGDGTEIVVTNRGVKKAGMENRDMKNLDVIRAVENHRVVMKIDETSTVGTKLDVTKTGHRIGIMMPIDRITHHDTIMAIDLTIDPMAEADLTEVPSEIKIGIDPEIEIMTDRLETHDPMIDLGMIDIETTDLEMINREVKERSK